ncbi:hypothetical protein ElyMa_002519000 [Elysia marginata]|uniref:Uncharacterized protein n=1 Tax=Elysia marginata TaxID=1093978 RepID=A0AAV4GVU2_9GAST|nr:hypothetical protein ElyMa_002519000 [Elysia marginata]
MKSLCAAPNTGMHLLRRDSTTNPQKIKKLTRRSSSRDREKCSRERRNASGISTAPHACFILFFTYLPDVTPKIDQWRASRGKDKVVTCSSPPRRPNSLIIAYDVGGKSNPPTTRLSHLLRLKLGSM